MDINSAEYGLSTATKLEKIDGDSIAIVVQRKSRIIMKDGQNIIKKAEKILNISPDASVYLKTDTAICSKTIAFLEEQGIGIIQSLE